MGYYREQRKAFKSISDSLKHVLLNKSNMNIDNFVISLTEKIEFSEKAIRARIDLIVRNNPTLEIRNGDVVYVE